MDIVHQLRYNESINKRGNNMQNNQLAVVRKELGRGGALCKEFNRVRLTADLDWKIEQAYALEIIRNSSALQKADPATIGRSMIDLAVMGLSLSPAMKEAYLIPYKGVCTASPSYMGLEQIAYRTGFVKKIECDVVKEKDEWREWSDRDGKNFSHVKAQGDRGQVTHAWCSMVMTSGEVKVEVMDRAALRGCREAAARKNNGEVPFVWKGPFKEEMYKKCAIRRAWKHWPKVRNPQLVSILEAVERTDPMDFGGETGNGVDHRKTIDPGATINSEQVDILVNLMRDAGVPEMGFDRQLQGLAVGMGVRNIHSLPMGRLDEAISLMERGLEKWKERQSATSDASSYEQDDTTARREAI